MLPNDECSKCLICLRKSTAQVGFHNTDYMPMHNTAAKLAHTWHSLQAVLR
jgi:hypothetical protein